MDNRTCRKCGKEKPVTDFYANPSGKREFICFVCRKLRQKEYYNNNKADHLAYVKAYRAKHGRELHEKERQRQYMLQTKYSGRPKPDVCDVCNRPPGKRGLAFDHDHAINKFRGWLCSNCNTTLGLVYDNPNVLRALADYIENGSDVNLPEIAFALCGHISAKSVVN